MAPVVVSQTNASYKSTESENYNKMFDHIGDSDDAFCYTCNTTAIGKDMANHLFLGRLDCKYCTVKIAVCDRFRELFYSSTHTCKQNKSGKHDFSKWQTPFSEYLSYFVRRELVIERFCQNKKGSPSQYEILVLVRDYMCKLSPIEDYEPWKNALKDCWNYLESKNLGKETCTSHNDSLNTSSESEDSFNTGGLNFLLQSETPDKNINSAEDTSSILQNEKVEKIKDPSENQTLLASTGTPVTNKQAEETVQSENSCQQQDEPDDELLSAFTTGGLDQTIEYVTIQDDCREKENDSIAEVPSSHQDGGEKTNGKRKSTSEGVGSSKKRKSQRYPTQNLEDFLSPDDIKNDHYLVIHFPTEGCPVECPNCYCEFTPSMLTVNCSTFVSIIVCEDCKLTIYVLPE